MVISLIKLANNIEETEAFSPVGLLSSYCLLQILNYMITEKNDQNEESNLNVNTENLFQKLKKNTKGNSPIVKSANENQASGEASGETNEPASGQTSEQASEQANEPASGQTSGQASEQANNKEQEPSGSLANENMVSV